jgi:sigma-54 specific flagellar transcriptional regulator A
VRIIAATHCDLEQAILKGTFRADLFYRLNVVPIDMPALRERGEDLPALIADLAQRIHVSGRPRVQFTAVAIDALKAYRWPGNVRELGNLIERLSIQCQSRAVTIGDLPARYRPADWTPGALPDCESVLVSAPVAAVLAPALEALVASEAAETVDISAPETGAVTDTDTACIEPQYADALLADIPAGFDLRQYLESLEQRLISRAMDAAGGTVAQAARVLGLRRTTLVEKLRKYAMAGSEAAVSDS